MLLTLHTKRFVKTDVLWQINLFTIQSKASEVTLLKIIQYFPLEDLKHISERKEYVVALKLLKH